MPMRFVFNHRSQKRQQFAHTRHQRINIRGNAWSLRIGFARALNFSPNILLFVPLIVRFLVARTTA